MPGDLTNQIDETLQWIENDVPGGKPIRRDAETAETYLARILKIKAALQGDLPEPRPCLQVKIIGGTAAGKTTLMQMFVNTCRAHGMQVTYEDTDRSQNWEPSSILRRAGAIAEKQVPIHITTLQVHHGRADLRQ